MKRKKKLEFSPNKLLTNCESISSDEIFKCGMGERSNIDFKYGSAQ